MKKFDVWSEKNIEEINEIGFDYKKLALIWSFRILKKKENRSRKGKRVFIDGWILQSLKVKL